MAVDYWIEDLRDSLEKPQRSEPQKHLHRQKPKTEDPRGAWTFSATLSRDTCVPQWGFLLSVIPLTVQLKSGDQRSKTNRNAFKRVANAKKCRPLNPWGIHPSRQTSRYPFTLPVTTEPTPPKEPLFLLVDDNEEDVLLANRAFEGAGVRNPIFSLKAEIKPSLI